MLNRSTVTGNRLPVTGYLPSINGCRTLAIALLMMAVAGGHAHAQVTIGAQVGVNRSSINGDSPPKIHYRPSLGFAAGAVVDIDVAEDVKLSLQPMYLQKAAKIAFEVPDEKEPRDSLDLALDYIALPILLKVTLGDRKLYVSGGLSVGFLASGSMTAGNETQDVKNIFKDFDLSADFGFGATIPIGKPFLTLEARYEQSILNNINPEEDPEGQSLPIRLRFSGFQFYAGLLIPLGKG